jgi:prostamide/prostaglandin F2alpha synthase
MAAKPSLDFHEHRPWSTVIDGPRRAAFERFRGPRRWPSWMLDAARPREQPATPEHIDALAVVVLPDQDGNEVRLRELWRAGPAVLVWLRQFGCPFCRAHSVELNRARTSFERAGARLVLIGQGSPEDASRFRNQMHIDLQILADADRVTYLWAGTKLATLDELIGPVVVGRALIAMARQRVVVGHTTADEAQLGGSIVVTPEGEIVSAHISQDASDMASVAELLAVVATVEPHGHGQADRT